MKKYYKPLFSLLFIVLVILLLVMFLHRGKKSGMLSSPWPVTDVRGIARNYNVYLPAETDEASPMLVYFHGVMSDGFKNKPVLKGYTGSPVSETGLIPFCRAKGIILLEIFPSYTYKFMDLDARGWSPLSEEIDGVEKCIDTVVEKNHIKPGNVFLAGISAGAVISHHLANRRPDKYRALLSHSQAYISEKNVLLEPTVNGRKFGVLFCYTKGDYRNLKELCEGSFAIYKKNGFRTVILRDLPPSGHKWSVSSNPRFWRLLLNLSQD